MIISNKNPDYPSAIQTAINNFNGYQIIISGIIPSNLCMFDKVQLLNSLLQKIYSKYRQINRRANIHEFLVVLSNRMDDPSLWTVLVNTHQLHNKTVQNRIVAVSEIITASGITANVFRPYNGVAEDLNRYHIKGHGSFSINVLKGNQPLQFMGCVDLSTSSSNSS